LKKHAKKMFLEREGVSGEYVLFGLAAAAVVGIVILLAVYWRGQMKNRMATASGRLGTALNNVPTTP